MTRCAHRTVTAVFPTPAVPTTAAIGALSVAFGQQRVELGQLTFAPDESGCVTRNLGRHEAGVRRCGELDRFALEDLALERPQLRPRVEAELVGQDGPRTAVGRHGVRLPAALVQRGHQQPVQPFPQRMPVHELGQLTGDLAIPAESKLHGVEVLHRHQPALGQPVDLADQVGDLHALVRRASPQVQRLADQLRTPPRVHRGDPARFVEECVEPVGVEFAGPSAEAVAVRAEGKPFGIVEHRAQPVHVDLEPLHTAVACLPTPERVDEDVHGYRFVRARQQHRQQAPAQRPGDRDHLTATTHPQRAKHFEPHPSPSPEVR